MNRPKVFNELSKGAKFYLSSWNQSECIKESSNTYKDSSGNIQEISPYETVWIL